MGFSLNIQTSVNMKNQRYPFQQKSEFVTSVQVLLFIDIPGPKCPRRQVSKTNDFLLNVRYIFFDAYEIFMTTSSLHTENRVRNFPYRIL